MARRALTLVAALAVALLVYLVVVGVLFRRLSEFAGDHFTTSIHPHTPTPKPLVVAPAPPSLPEDAVEQHWIVLAALLAALVWCCTELHVLLLRRADERRKLRRFSP